MMLEATCGVYGQYDLYRDRKWPPVQRLWMVSSTRPPRPLLTTPTQAPCAPPTPPNETPQRCTWSPKLCWRADVSVDQKTSSVVLRSFFLTLCPVQLETLISLHNSDGVLLVHRASHQRHRCFSKERHWNRLWLSCSGRRRSTTASKYI